MSAIQIRTPAPARDQLVSVRLTRREKEAIENCADTFGHSVSDFLRISLTRQSRNQKG
jgi:uncharacterized protein (DUF1778 family)